MRSKAQQAFGEEQEKDMMIPLCIDDYNKHMGVLILLINCAVTMTSSSFPGAPGGLCSSGNMTLWL